jgi:hypothetical protein
LTHSAAVQSLYHRFSRRGLITRKLTAIAQVGLVEKAFAAAAFFSLPMAALLPFPFLWRLNRFNDPFSLQQEQRSV